MQVGLFSLRRQTGRRSTTLHVNQHQRQFSHHGKAEGFALESQTRTGGGGNGKVTGKGCSYCRTDAANLVLHLDSLDAKVAALGQLMKDIGGRGNRVRPKEQWATAHLRGLDKSPSSSFVACYVSISAGAHIITLDAVR